MTPYAAIEPIVLRDYLKAEGWVQRPEGLRYRAYILTHPALPKRELYFPMEKEADDYSAAVASVLAKYADITHTTIDAVTAAVKAVYDDVLRFRIFTESGGSNVPLDFASEFTAGLEKLLRAATCTAVRPRAYHPRLALTEATKMVETAQFGQTDEGSFIFQVLCPINAMDAPATSDLFGTLPTPFVRQVTLNIQQGLLMLTNAIESDGLGELVEHEKEAKSPVLSSNLCEAVCAMQDGDLQNSLDVTVRWSPTKGVPAPEFLQRVRVQKNYFARIEEVGRELKAIDKPKEDRFLGTVERLDGTMDASGRRSGTVVLLLMLSDGETVRASATLDADQYEKADRAHMTPGAFVAVAGVLNPGRQPRALTQIQHFNILGNVFD